MADPTDGLLNALDQAVRVHRRPINHDHAGQMDWLPDAREARRAICRGCGQEWILMVSYDAFGRALARWEPILQGAPLDEVVS